MNSDDEPKAEDNEEQRVYRSFLGNMKRMAAISLARMERGSAFIHKFIKGATPSKSILKGKGLDAMALSGHARTQVLHADKSMGDSRSGGASCAHARRPPQVQPASTHYPTMTSLVDSNLHACLLTVL